MNLYDWSNFVKTETELSGDRKWDISITLEDGSQGSVVLGQELNCSIDFNQPPTGLEHWLPWKSGSAGRIWKLPLAGQAPECF